MMSLPEPNFAHLLAMRGPYGTFEHAKMSSPRVEHGYCTDDVARVAIVLARQSETFLPPALKELLWSSMHFLEMAQSSSGEFLNRRRCAGDWELRASANDWWGRAMWAFGSIFARCDDPGLRALASRAFERGATVRSPWPRSMAFAMLGASEYLAAAPGSVAARDLLEAGAAALDRPHVSSSWRWPEERLAYANATLPEALLAAGVLLGRDQAVEVGLDRLGWLLDCETVRGHLGVTPHRGRGADDSPRIFDQQPIEVAAMADACVRAFALTNDSRWREGRELCGQWFAGHNDGGVVMFDAHTGGGYDGLTPSGPNLNQGAESTLALLSTQQHARRVAVAAP